MGSEGYHPTDDYTGTGEFGFGGTSSATPLASGIGALVLAQSDVMGVTLAPADLRSYLRNNTDLIGGVTYDPETGKNLEFGYGRLNAASAVSGIGKAEISVLSEQTDLVNNSSLINLGPVTVGSFVDRVFRIRNQGTSTLNISSLFVSAGPFSIVSNPSDTNLGIGESTTFTIRYQPSSGGSFTNTIGILSNDLNETSFEFNVIAEGISPSIAGKVFEDFTGDNINDSFENALAGRVVYLDENNNGQFDGLTTTFTSTEIVPINDRSTVTSSINLLGYSSSPLLDVNVSIRLTHFYNSDLAITLIAPNGTRVPLSTNRGGNSRDYILTVFDDEATSPISSGTGPFTGSFQPESPLSVLDGINVNGTWTLEIADQALGDIGSLLEWGIELTVLEESTTTDVNGNYAFLGLPVGIYNVGLQDASGWTSSNSSLVNVNLPFTDSFVGNVNFGSAKNDRFYGRVFEDRDRNGIVGPSESGLAGRTVFIDTNTNGVLDNSTTSLASGVINLPVPYPGPETSTISASGFDLPIVDVNVRVNISMAFNDDLIVYLVHPDGTRIELFSRVGGSGSNFSNTILDDQAPTAIIDGTAPFSGSYRPEGLLAALNGKSANGDWKLELSDVFSADDATVIDWEIILQTGETETTTDANGFTKLDLPSGFSNVQLVPVVGSRFTSPVQGYIQAFTANAPIYSQSFGTYANTAPELFEENSFLSVIEGQTANNTGFWADLDGDIVELTASEGQITQNPDGTWFWSYSSLDDYDTSIMITASDQFGGQTSTIFYLSVINEAPLISAYSYSVIGNVNTTLTISGIVDDVFADTVTLVASPGTISFSGIGEWTWSYDAGPNPEGGDVTIQALDEDGGVSFIDILFTVNAHPEIILPTNSISYIENATPLLLFTGATVFDDFAGATVITLLNTNGEASDQLSFVPNATYALVGNEIQVGR